MKLARNPAEAADEASQILGMTIKGLTVHKVLVVPAAEIVTESYVGLIMDRETQQPVFMVSSAGGVDIEEVAAKTPEKIVRLPVDPTYGLFPHQALSLAFVLYRDFAQVKAAAKMMEQLYRAFIDNGASLAEINPLVTTPDGKVLALDAKIVIDDNELFWRPDLGVLRDDSAEEPSEAAARRANLSFIKLDGDVGCVVNGAGLAMATMDLVKYYGGEPANFLDIGGSSSPEKVINALKIITADPNVKAILFNIFGGITRTDDVANGIVAATRQFKVNVPIVIRLTGTNETEAIRILNGVGMPALERHGRGGPAGGAAGAGGRMSIFADAATRLVIQGITGREGSFHARQMIEYGTNVVAGVTPGKGGQTFEGKVPVFNTVADAVKATQANTAVIYVPPMGAAAAVIEAADAGIPLVVCITEGIPVLHMSRAMPFVRSRGVRLIGPNCPGLITPGARRQDRDHPRQHLLARAESVWCPAAAR